MFIKKYGLFWRCADVTWGESRPGGAGEFRGVPINNLNAEPEDISQQIGFYVLYNIYDNRDISDSRDIFNNQAARDACDNPYRDCDELVYCGYSGRDEGQEWALFDRIRQHQQPSSDFYERWNQFSWFGIGDLGNDNIFPQENLNNAEIRSNFLKQIEAVMIATSRPTLNRMAGDFREAQRYSLHIPD